MNKVKALRVVNIFLIVTAVIQIVTSLILFFRLMPAHAGVIVKIHVHNGIAFIAIALIHLTLNFDWVKAQYLSFKR